MLRLLLVMLAIALLTGRVGAEEYGGIEFPSGEASFADQVLDYEPEFSGGAVPTDPDFKDPAQASGTPDYTGSFDGEGAVALGQGGKLELLFGDNVLTNSGDGSTDLAIFEVGPEAENLFVALRPSNSAVEGLLDGICVDDIAPFGDGFCEIGTVSGGITEVDVDSTFTSFGTGVLRFDAIQLIDDPDQGNHTGTASGSDIDSIGGVASATIDCGDGLVEGAEECDDGGVEADDGCGPDCSVETCWTCPGEPSSCGPAEEGGACDDGDPCTTADECDGSTPPACVGGPPPSCDDDNVCTQDVCVSPTGCEHNPVAGSCDDESSCTTDDACSAGSCVGTAVQASGCLRVTRLIAPFRVRDREDDQRDALVWKWPRGELTTLGDFGSPTSPPGAYELCVFDNSGGSLSLRVGARALKGGVCGTRMCWKPKGTKGFRYKNKAATHGLKTIILKSGEDGKAKILVKAQGPELHLNLPLVEPVKVQLKDTASGICWEADYDTPIRNDEDRFKAKQ